jgi:hypothetical protein
VLPGAPPERRASPLFRKPLPLLIRPLLPLLFCPLTLLLCPLPPRLRSPLPLLRLPLLFPGAAATLSGAALASATRYGRCTGREGCGLRAEEWRDAHRTGWEAA